MADKDGFSGGLASSLGQENIYRTGQTGRILEMIRQDVYYRIDTVGLMFRAATASAAHFYRLCLSDPTRLDGTGLRVRDIRDCMVDLEGTFLVRAYAVFEITLRHFWHEALRRKTFPIAEHLINGVASKCKALGAELRAVHAARAYRNWLVHGGAEPTKVTVDQGIASIRGFLRRLPASW